MKFFTTIIIVLLLAFVMTGCSLLGDPVAEKVASVIDKYCEEPQGARELYRETINAELATEGHTITVICSGDTPPPETSYLMPLESGHAVAYVATGPPH